MVVRRVRRGVMALEAPNELLPKVGREEPRVGRANLERRILGLRHDRPARGGATDVDAPR